MTNINPLQFQTKDINEREITTLNSDNIRYDSPPTIGVSVSPKKKFLIRSQSHTEPTSPIQNNNPNNNLSQSHKSNSDSSILNTQNSLDDENSMDDSVNNHFTRIPDIPTIAHPSDTHQQQYKSNDQQLNIQLRADQNGIPHPMIKQQPIVINNMNPNKRTFQQGKILFRMTNIRIFFNLIR